MKDRLKVFQDRQWLADLPDSVTKSLINVRRYAPAANLPMGPLLQPVLELASQFNVERGKADILVQDEQSRLTGAVSGGSLAIESMPGKVSLPLADVALLCGGGGMDRPMRVYLRNGEILLGRIQGADLTLKAQGGVEAKLPLAKVNMLFLHATADDGKAPAEACAMLQTHDGQRLLVSGSDARFQAASPWGGLELDLGEIVSLARRHEPQPLYRLSLRDGSELSVVLQGEMPAVNSLRFGPVKLAAVGLRQIWSLKAPPAKKTNAEEDDLTAAPAGPRCQLIGDNVLAGTIAAPRLLLATPGGTLELAVSGIQTAQRTGDPKADGPFQFEMANGRQVTGTLANRTVPFRFHGTVWEISAQHLIGFTGPAKSAAHGVADKPVETGERYDYDSGSFSFHLREGQREWVETATDGHIKAHFAETARDREWIHLFDAGRNMLLRLPVGGGTCAFSTDDGKTWNNLHHVEKAKSPRPRDEGKGPATVPPALPTPSAPVLRPAPPAGGDDPFGP
jgi:hypothetical protein